jgi:hypothetical protein
MNMILLNIWVTIFLLTSFFSSLYTIKKFSITGNTKAISPIISLIILFLTLGIILSLFYIFPTFIQYYIYLVFGVLSIGSALWYTQHMSFIYKIALIICFVIVYVLRFVIPSSITHNVLIIFSLVWLGSFLIQLNFLNKKSFFIVTLIWIIYDILFVWLTSVSSQVNLVSKQIQFPMGLEVEGNLVGTGDLLFATILVHILQTKEKKIVAISMLIGSLLLVDLFHLLIYPLYTLPLLIIWGPIILFLLKRQVGKN